MLAPAYFKMGQSFKTGGLLMYFMSDISPKTLWLWDKITNSSFS